MTPEQEYALYIDPDNQVPQGSAVPVTGPGLAQDIGKTLDLDEVIVLPRSVREILEHGDELAKRFEDYSHRLEGRA